MTARPIPRTERGFALLLAVLTLFIAATTLMIGALLTRLALSEADAERRLLHLQALSDAAIAESLAGLCADRAYVGFARRPFDRGWMESRVDNFGNQRALIEVRVGVAGRVRTATVDVSLTGPRPRITDWRQGSIVNLQ